MAALALFVPGADEWLKENPDIVVAMAAAVNFVLRFFTKEAVIALLLLLPACSSMNQQLDQEMFYKRDIKIEINDEQYEGVVTVPHADSYELVLKPPGKIDLLLIQSCHREFSAEKLSAGWFGKNQFKYLYEPIKGLEDTGRCVLRIEVYEAVKGRHSWALVNFEHPDFALPFKMDCNGEVKLANGAAVCQAKHGLIQRLHFIQPVQFAPPLPSSCDIPVKHGDHYRLKQSLGECLYYVRNEAGLMGKIITVGYEGVLVRETQ